MLYRTCLAVALPTIISEVIGPNSTRDGCVFIVKVIVICVLTEGSGWLGWLSDVVVGLVIERS